MRFLPVFVVTMLVSFCSQTAKADYLNFFNNLDGFTNVSMIPTTYQVNDPSAGIVDFSMSSNSATGLRPESNVNGITPNFGSDFLWRENTVIPIGRHSLIEIDFQTQTIETAGWVSYSMWFYNQSNAPWSTDFILTMNGESPTVIPSDISGLVGPSPMDGWEKRTWSFRIPDASPLIGQTLSFDLTVNMNDIFETAIDGVEIIGIPEPSQWALLAGMCLLGLVTIRRRK